MLSTKEIKAVIWWLDTPLLREANEGDAEALHEYFKVLAAEPMNTISIGSTILAQSAEDQRQMIRACAQSDHSALFVLDAGDTIVGVALLTGNDRPARAHTVELSLNVHPDHRGHGYGSMLLEHALDWARSREQLHRVELEVATHNDGAFRLYARLGFRLEGVRRRSHYFFDEAGGQFVDTYVMARFL